MAQCIDFIGYKDKDGYGIITHHKKSQRIHRVVYCEHNKVDLESIVGKVIRHTCDNPSCVNPRHLIVGTHQDNTNDMKARKRHLPNDTHLNAVLSVEDVKYIREVYKARCPNFGAKALAKRLGTSYKNISAIALNKTWKHIGV